MSAVSLVCRPAVLGTLLLCLIAGIATAQKKKATPSIPSPAISFGSVLADEFVDAPADSSAEAVVLYSYGEVTFEEFDGDVWINFIKHVRTRIRKKSAFGRATIEIPIRKGSSGHDQLVKDFEGYSYNNANGSIARNPISKENHFTEKVSDKVLMEKYTLPTVREGTIIEYKYTFRSPFSVQYNPNTWWFQQNIPVRWSEYRITVPDYYYYKILQTGYLPLTVNERTNTTVDLYAGQNGASASAYRLAMKDVPAFRDEPYITNDDDYMAKIEFELASYMWRDLRKNDLSVDWASLDRTLLLDSDFGSQIKRGGFLRDVAKELTAQGTDTLSRVKAAYAFIQKNIKWNGEGGYFSLEGIKRVFDNKKGNSGGINLMLVALLREMDLDANPVILSTRSNGRISEDIALQKKFNYVVAQVSVGGKDLLLDATDPFLEAGMLPVHCLNGTGRLVHSSKSRFISLAPTERDIESMSGTFTIDEDGEVTGQFKQSRGGYNALRTRKEYATDGQAKFLNGEVKKRPSWQLEKTEFSGADVQSSTFNTNYTITVPEACGRAGDRLYLRPMLTEGIGANPFKEADRLYPVDLAYGKEQTFSATYTLPKGYQVEELPKSVSMALPENGGRFVYQLTVNADNQLQVVSRLTLRKAVYSAAEYPNLRELFSRIVAKQAEPVVLKRGAAAEKK